MSDATNLFFDCVWIGVACLFLVMFIIVYGALIHDYYRLFMHNLPRNDSISMDPFPWFFKLFFRSFKTMPMSTQKTLGESGGGGSGKRTLSGFIGYFFFKKRKLRPTFETIFDLLPLLKSFNGLKNWVWTLLQPEMWLIEHLTDMRWVSYPPPPPLPPSWLYFLILFL
jgi:hypothetical protein